MTTHIKHIVFVNSIQLPLKRYARFQISLALAGIACIGSLRLSPAKADEVQRVLYVKSDAIGVGNGTNWTDAYSDLQDALAVASPGDQIWVGAGVYTPSRIGRRSDTFQLKSGVGLYGGFTGTEVVLSERDPAVDMTVLSGDLSRNDLEALAPRELMNEPSRSDNSYHVVTGSDADETAVLDGFVITGGNANVAGDDKGGGMMNVLSVNGSDLASPTLINCHFHRNSAAVNGGGVYNEIGMPTFVDCVFSENHANGGVWEKGGGGMYNERGDLTIRNCRFDGNTSAGGGAGLHNRNASPTIMDTVFENNVILRYSHDNNGGGVLNNTSDAKITDCSFIENVGSFGGGVWNYSSPAPTITNCIFSRNHAAHPGDGAGGGLQNWTGNPTVVNCTFVENSAVGSAGGLGEGGGSRTTVSNSIFWGNTAPSAAQIGGGSTSVTYSCVQGNISGEGNIDVDPHFVTLGHWGDINDPNLVRDADDPNAVWVDADYHLKSSAGRWNPYSETWVIDDVTSPCIDRGNPRNPIGNEPDPNGGIINMGAYGGTSEASLSIGHPAPLPPIAHWRLDEAEGDVAYDSARQNDAILVGAPLWMPDGGQIDGALQFDGKNDYADTLLSLNPSETVFSVFAWIKGGAAGQVIVSQSQGMNWLTLGPESGSLQTELTHMARGKLGPSLDSQRVIDDGDWHRIGLVWDSTHRILYVDDVDVARDESAGLTPSEGNLIIGAGAGLEDGSFFSGLIDDVRIYDRAVSP